jgi:hypothetical protein
MFDSPHLLVAQETQRLVSEPGVLRLHVPISPLRKHMRLPRPKAWLQTVDIGTLVCSAGHQRGTK